MNHSHRGVLHDLAERLCGREQAAVRKAMEMFDSMPKDCFGDTIVPGKVYGRLYAGYSGERAYFCEATMAGEDMDYYSPTEVSDADWASSCPLPCKDYIEAERMTTEQFKMHMVIEDMRRVESPDA